MGTPESGSGMLANPGYGWRRDISLDRERADRARDTFGTNSLWHQQQYLERTRHAGRPARRTAGWREQGAPDSSDYIFFEGAGIGLEADLWPIGEAFVRRKFREIIKAPLQLASDRSVDIVLEINPPSERLTVK